MPWDCLQRTAHRQARAGSLCYIAQCTHDGINEKCRIERCVVQLHAPRLNLARIQRDGQIGETFALLDQHRVGDTLRYMQIHLRLPADRDRIVEAQQSSWKSEEKYGDDSLVDK